MSRVLVAYGTKHGATAEIAESIGDVLRAGGHEADVEPAGSVGDLSGYDAVVLGSAVYAGRWRREARRLLARLGKESNGRAIWLFSSGPAAGDPPDPGNKWHHPTRVRVAGERLGARDQAVFGGRVPPDPGNFMERAMLKKTPEDQRDARDFAAIASWAHEIGALVKG
jgi:menaquinone-dependent protoporphyrinogen oxidase